MFNASKLKAIAPAVAAVPAAQVEAPPPSTRELSRRRAISRFRWSILGPLIALLVFVLMPVLFLQLYFSLHQWTVPGGMPNMSAWSFSRKC